ncbi:MAG: patatin-like phospholipase family protein [Mesorhizobium sp.]|nr:patatin-like phospholipase family protein [Mesorhizobium sp.]MBL8576654.1 patatin-like phospholipase family protein [Mesorhizobium sp.]
MRAAFSSVCIAFAGLVLSACVSADVGPINTHVAQAGRPSAQYIPNAADDGSTVIGLAISGGGTRAAAFGYGVLRGLQEIVVDSYPERRTLIDDIRMISGTSGGAVTAAYFGLKGRGYVDLRERFLLADAEKELHKSEFSPANWVRIYNGGANDRSTFADWLNRKVFDGKTYTSFRRKDAPIVWINASDIYNATPFAFTYDTFAALCSDLDKVRIADAVAASAAFPVVFAPLVISTATPSRKCGYQQPEWLTRALADPAASIRLKAYARALDTYQNDDNVEYIKLLDGGLTDNIGVTGFSLEREAAKSAHGPLSAEEAVKLKTFVFIVADASIRTEGDWVQTKNGPKFPQMVGAISNASIRSSVRDEFDALRMAVAAWRGKLVTWRCGLPAETVRQYRGTLAGWDCRDVELVVENVSFDDFAQPERSRLNAVPTRLKLPREQVDLVISAGTQSLRDNVILRDAFYRIQRKAGVKPLSASLD